MGVILYEMLTGKLPFTGPIAHGSDERPAAEPSHCRPRSPTPPSRPQLQEVLYRALERDPKNRYAHGARICARSGASGPGGRGGPARIARLAEAQSRSCSRKILYYGALALIPVVILLLMMLARPSPVTHAFERLQKSSRVPYAPGSRIWMNTHIISCPEGDP